MKKQTILGRTLSDYVYNYVSGLWVITPYYNPLGYASRRANYDIFVGLLRESGINVLTVECAFGDQPFDLPESTDVIRVNCGTLLWQKERILNLALPWLPPSCKYVAWLDCDIVFANANWARDTVRLLNEVPIVQVFETCNRLPKDHADAGCEGDVCTSFCRIVADDPGVLKSGKFSDHGHTGYGWAARREVLDEHGLYEYAIAGSADHYMSHAMVGDHDSPCIERIMRGNPELYRHLKEWADPFFATVGGAFKTVPGEILHLWHGDLTNRKYYLRHMELAQFMFNPYRDIIAAPGRAFELRPDLANSELATWFRSYFEQRHEDGVLAAA